MPVTSPQAHEFEQIVRRVTPVGLGYLMRRCDPRSDAADVWQAVLVTAWRRFDSLPDDPGSQAAWFVHAARHELSHHRRSAQRRDAATQRLMNVLSTQPVGAQNPDVSHLLDLLSSLDREIVQLTYWEQLTSEQIGIVMGLSAGAVRKRLQRSRDVMRNAATAPCPAGDPSLA